MMEAFPAQDELVATLSKISATLSWRSKILAGLVFCIKEFHVCDAWSQYLLNLESQTLAGFNVNEFTELFGYNLLDLIAS